jgi:hypothetical protein
MFVLFMMALALMTMLVMAFVNAVAMFSVEICDAHGTVSTLTSKLCTLGNWRWYANLLKCFFTGWRRELALSTRRRSTTVWNQKVRIASAFNLLVVEQNISVCWIRN